MARKTRARSRHKARRGRSSHLSAAGVIARSGWGRFAFGILIGLALGVGGALYLGGFELGNTGGAKVTTLNAAPVQKAAQKTAEAPAKSQPAPQVVEPPPAPAHAKPLGEEAKITAQATPAKPPAPTVPPAAQVATIAPPPVHAGPDAAWLKNAVAFSVPPGKPLIAVVLDDVGVARSHAELAIDLPGVITLSFMTYADGVADMAARARAKGHELMLHVPMEPLGHEIDAGPHVLTVDAPESELLKRLAWGLDRFSGYVGINNHMGSRFTQDERGMGVVLAELKRRNLLFLDSRTIGNTVGDKLAARMGVAHVMRDVFLDNEMDQAAVIKQLMQAERVAASKGQAIAIGHPHPATIAAIRAWMPKAEARGFVIVPLSAVAKLRLGASG
jgi:uncharacterized protein